MDGDSDRYLQGVRRWVHSVSMAQQGAFINFGMRVMVQISVPSPDQDAAAARIGPVVSASAMLDTGAVGTVISRDLAGRIGLKPAGVVGLVMGSGVEDADLAMLRVELPMESAGDRYMIPIVVKTAIRDGLTSGSEMLLGRNFLAGFDLSWSAKSASWQLAWDQPEQLVRVPGHWRTRAVRAGLTPLSDLHND